MSRGYDPNKAIPVEIAEKQYKESIFPKQRGKWKHGNRENTFSKNYDKIKWKKEEESHV